MTWPANAPYWLVAVVMVAVAAMGAVPSLINGRGIKAVKAETAEINGQVTNGHVDAPPMREEIDSLRVSIDHLTKTVIGIRDEVRGGFADQRADATEERSARRDGDQVLADTQRELSRRVSALESPGHASR